jgi:hypothetical protein
LDAFSGADLTLHAHRAELEATPHLRLSENLTFNGRTRFENRWIEGNGSWNPLLRIRPELVLKVRHAGPLTQGFTSNEFFYDLERGRYLFNRMIPAGVTFELGGDVRLRLMYIVDPQERNDGWHHVHAFQTQLHYSFRWTRRRTGSLVQTPLSHRGRAVKYAVEHRAVRLAAAEDILEGSLRAIAWNRGRIRQEIHPGAPRQILQPQMHRREAGGLIFRQVQQRHQHSFTTQPAVDPRRCPVGHRRGQAVCRVGGENDHVRLDGVGSGPTCQLSVGEEFKLPAGKLELRPLPQLLHDPVTQPQRTIPAGAVLIEDDRPELFGSIKRWSGAGHCDIQTSALYDRGQTKLVHQLFTASDGPIAVRRKPQRALSFSDAAVPREVW